MDLSKINSIEELDILYNQINVEEKAIKLILNSLYGALGSPYFKYADSDIPMSITACGRYFIKKLADNLENKFQSLKQSKTKYVCYGDTDSVYFSVNELIKHLDKDKQLDAALKIENKIVQEILKQTIEEYSNELNAFDKKSISADTEVLMDSVYFLAKKKYYGNIVVQDGVKLHNPKLKYMGIELAKGTTPIFFKQKIEEIAKLFLNGNDVSKIIDNVKNEIKQIKDISIITCSSSVSYIPTHLKLGTPALHKASYYFNKFAEKNNYFYNNIALDKLTEGIVNYCYIKTPNPFDTNLIAFDANTNEEFNNLILKYYDFNVNVDKFLIAPLDRMGCKILKNKSLF